MSQFSRRQPIAALTLFSDPNALDPICGVSIHGRHVLRSANETALPCEVGSLFRCHTRHPSTPSLTRVGRPLGWCQLRIECARPLAGIFLRQFRMQLVSTAPVRPRQPGMQFVGTQSSLVRVLGAFRRPVLARVTGRATRHDVVGDVAFRRNETVRMAPRTIWEWRNSTALPARHTSDRILLASGQRHIFQSAAAASAAPTTSAIRSRQLTWSQRNGHGSGRPCRSQRQKR